MPAASLPALEYQLEARLLELDHLQRARRQLGSALAVALEDAAAKLRRLSTYLA